MNFQSGPGPFGQCDTVFVCVHHPMDVNWSNEDVIEVYGRLSVLIQGLKQKYCINYLGIKAIFMHILSHIYNFYEI